MQQDSTNLVMYYGPPTRENRQIKLIQFYIVLILEKNLKGFLRCAVRGKNYDIINVAYATIGRFNAIWMPISSDVYHAIPMGQDIYFNNLLLELLIPNVHLIEIALIWNAVRLEHNQMR